MQVIILFLLSFKSIVISYYLTISFIFTLMQCYTGKMKLFYEDELLNQPISESVYQSIPTFNHVYTYVCT